MPNHPVFVTCLIWAQTVCTPLSDTQNCSTISSEVLLEAGWYALVWVKFQGNLFERSKGSTVVITVLHRMNHFKQTLGFDSLWSLENFANAAEVDLVGRLLPALAPDRGEEECPGVAVAGVAVRAQADAQPLLLQFPLLSPSLLLFTLPASLVPGRFFTLLPTRCAIKGYCFKAAVVLWV